MIDVSESVVVMPAFGVQLETHYVRYFFPFWSYERYLPFMGMNVQTILCFRLSYQYNDKFLHDIVSLYQKLLQFVRNV